MRAAALFFLIVSVPLTSGCVAAAVAAPFVAGGALATSDRISERRTDETPGSAPTQAPVPTANAPGPENIAATPAASQVPATKGAVGAGEPVGYTRPTSGSLASMARYTEGVVEKIGEDSVPSAVLAEPSALDGERILCEDAPPVILIDMDPAKQIFSGVEDISDWPQIAQDLAAIRRNGVSIAWISGNSAANADIVRSALMTTGLDPTGEDLLLLMRYPADRKQTRRAELAREFCLFAIAGAERADFDELYNYLKNPNAALRLERLIGNGWFLLSPQSSPIGPLPGKGQAIVTSEETSQQ